MQRTAAHDVGSRPNATPWAHGVASKPQPLRRRPAWRKQGAEEIVIRWILDPVAIEIFPPPSAQVSRLAGTELGLTVCQELELAFHRQGILDHERVVIQPLTGDEDDARRAVPETSGRRRGRCRKSGRRRGGLLRTAERGTDNQAAERQWHDANPHACPP